MNICRHFNECGGCSFQDISYSQQIDDKKKRLVEISDLKNIDIIPSPEIWKFRNKMEYSFEGENLGLHPRGRFDRVVDLKECPVFSDWVGDFFKKVREFASKNEISYYDRKKKKGTLRYIIPRESKFTGQKMVILAVNENEFNHHHEWVEMVKDNVENISSIVLARRHTSGDTAYTDDYEILSGKKQIEMKAGDLSLKMSPFSFFQPNSYQIDNMYSIISSGIKGRADIMDLYSGVGSISFYLAHPGRSITAVESCPSCMQDASHNKNSLNPPGEIRFREDTVRSFLSEIKRKCDYVILDPPRGGMSYKVWLHLDRINREIGKLKKIYYICCSLNNLKRDLEFIRGSMKWKINKVTGVDMFVHTPHLETIVELTP
ncbi:MAG: 23S rRNA (uracil(1939)-C(5))-methyltransferase RlmD [Elusimicrobiota bacterium]